MDKFVEENEVFEKYSIIKREQYADFLTNFLNQQAENGYVLNLNAEWGAGKTTFLKCWYNKLKANHPVVYFDAWKTDFTHDAMTALMDSFHAQLANPISDNKALIRDFYEKGMHFIKISVPSLAVGYLKHKSGMQNDESLLQDITDTFGINVTEDSCSDALKETLKAALEQRKKVEGIYEFKTALENIADEYIKVSNKHIPIYVFIDELDRCRPNYAIEVIENVKHFFNTKNFVFVIATDTKQLQHSIKAIYGYQFDSNLYLSRFFNQSVTLPQPKLIEFILSKYQLKLDTSFPTDKNIIDDTLIAKLITKVFKYHNINSLREIDKILISLDSCGKSADKELNVLSLLILLILRNFHPKIYNKFKNQKLIPYRGINASVTNELASPVYNQHTVENLSLDCITKHSLSFENFIHLSLAEITRQSTNHYRTVDASKILSIPNHNIHTVYSGLIANIVFNNFKEQAVFDDYINLVDLHFIE